MKKLIVALMLVTTLVSCGKDNKLASGAGPGAPGIGSSPITNINNDTRFQSLATAIANNDFNKMANLVTAYEYATPSSTCVDKEGWFGIDYQKCSTTISNIRKVVDGTLDLESKKAELNAILSKTIQYTTDGYYLHSVRTNDNFTYVIDLSKPLKANPVYKYNHATAKAEFLNKIIY